MDYGRQADNEKKITNDKHILALSWNIATDPKLYRELAPNPYSHEALKVISEKFPDESITDVIRAVILAEPEGIYDRNFRQLGKIAQREELREQKERTNAINKHFVYYCKEHKKELRLLSKDVVYSILFLAIFEAIDTKEIEQRFAQEQRRDLKMAIVNFIEDTNIRVAFKKKNTRKRPLLLLAFAVPSLMLFMYVTQQQIHILAQPPRAKKQILAAEIQNKNEGFPMRLEIPSINVNAAVEYVGITVKGAMDVPINTIDVGLFKFGAYPGENGSAVIAGHYDSQTGAPGVFANLNELKKGDKVYINYANGISLVYVVQESHLYNPGFAKDVFSDNNGAHLNLITCDGVWDAGKKSYNKRLVVFTNISH